MKTTAALLLLSLCLNSFAQGVLLGPGDTYSYSFSNLNYGGELGGGKPQASFSAHFTGDLLDPGESVRLEMFESSLSDSPVASLDVTALTTARSRADLFVGTNPLPWLDFQGAVRFTMLSGSVGLASVGVNTMIGTSSYGVLTAVPEPGSLALLCLGLAAGAVWRLKWR